MSASSPRPADWNAARRALAEAVRRAGAERNGKSRGENGSEPSVPRRVEVPAPAGTDLLRWLAAQPAPRGFWSGREPAGGARAFTGRAERFERPSRLCARLKNAPAGASAPLRYFGGIRFDPERPAAGGWEDFGPGAFVLPRFELAKDGPDGPVRLACHLAPADDVEAVAAEAAHLALPAPGEAAESASPEADGREDQPDRDGWVENVHAALAEMADGGVLRKVVLARRTALRLRDPLCPVDLLRRLRTRAPQGFSFLVEPERAGAFLGVTPERLFRQRGRRIESEAVAGTRPRAAAAADDDALREELLQSDKDRREHAFVQRSIRDALGPLCVSLQEQGPAPLTLRRGRHLRAGLRGRLRDGASPADVLRALHPTPAVGGVPTGAARQFIRAHEPFDRGWYAAPVGWVGRTADGAPAAELAVGIRSGLVREDGRRLDLFSGAGLVEGSVPADEWDEIEQKLGNFAAVLGRSLAPVPEEAAD